MDKDGNYPVLREYPLQASLSEQIPARAQRGLSTFNLEFTCLDADGSYLVIGSNIGVAYLVHREKDYVQKLKDNEHKSPVSCVRLLVSLECMVAVGFKSGSVLVYKVPFQENLQLEKFSVEGLHSSGISALEWAKNGIKFFSGDQNGVVVCTEIDHLEHQSRSRILVDEKSKVVQLSYNHLNLVVSTLYRSFIYSLQTNTISQIGQKERKCFGPFGATIFDTQNNTLFASRPGQRLWKSDITGTIQETLLFKTALSQPCPVVETLSKTGENASFSDFQFELLSKFDSYILIWSDSYFTLIDPAEKVVVAVSPRLDPIIDVAVCKNEIFILRGLRHILRISTEPDIYGSTQATTEEPSLFEEILEPLKGLSTYVKERSDSLTVQPESNSKIFDWLKKKRSASSPADIPDGMLIDQNQMTTSESLPEIVNLNSKDCIPVKVDEFSSVPTDIPELVTKDITEVNDSDDLVYKVKKKHKKNKKVKFAVDAAPTRDRHKSKPDANSKGKADSNMDNIAKSDIVNNEANLQSDTTAGTNALESNSASNNTENTKQNTNKGILINHSQISDVTAKYVDADQLLENVLNAYSHSKHKDFSSDDLKNMESSASLNESDNANQNITPDKDVCNGNENKSHQAVNENVITSDANDQDARAAEGDVYSSLTDNTPLPKSEGSVESLSLEDSSISSVESRSNDPPKYGVDWVEYKAPELLLDISVSSDHIFCVDVRNQMYFSRHPQMGSLHWMELEQPAEKIAASEFETVVWALYRGTVYAASHKSLSLWENTEWVSIARDVVSIAVDNDCGWYAKSNGELLTQQNLTLTQPTSYPETVSCSSPALQVAIKDGVLWVLTVRGSLLALNATKRKSKSVWKEIVLKDVPGIDGIFLGSNKTGWIVDSYGMIRFIIGITPETPEGTGEPWLVEASTYLFRPVTQLEQVVRRALNSETLTNLIRGKQHLCLSSSDMGIWFCKTYDNLLYSNQKDIIGHTWELIIPPSTAAATKWTLIAADGINNSEGALWCLASAGEFFCYNIKSKSLITVELPTASPIRCIQPKYQSLWLLSEDGNIHIRRGITANCVQGIWWQALDLTQFGSQVITHINCSSFVSWACTSHGEVYMRLGSLSPSATSLSQAWISIGTANEQAYSPLEKLSTIGKRFPLPLIPTQITQDGFSKVYVGPQGYPVWAIDKKRNVYVREGVTINLPIGEKWMLLPDLHAKELCITNSAVWLLKSSGKIFRRFGVTEKNPCGDYWKQMPGSLDWLTATEDDDLWGLQNGSMFCHYSFVLHSTTNSNAKCPPKRMISEDDWEDIMAEDFEILE